jgi:hypothetical protein
MRLGIIQLHCAHAGTPRLFDLLHNHLHVSHIILLMLFLFWQGLGQLLLVWLVQLLGSLGQDLLKRHLFPLSLARGQTLPISSILLGAEKTFLSKRILS